MGRIRFSRSRALLTCSLISLSIFYSIHTSPVYAAGYQINETSPSLQGDALAGAAAASNDVTSLFINPATLSTLKDNQAYLGGSEILPRIHVSKESAIHTVNVPGEPPSNITAQVSGTTSQNNISKGVFVPDGYFGWRMNENLVAGIAIVAPFGLTSKYYDNSVLRFASIYSSVKSMNINPAIAYKINDQWAVGLGFQLQYVRAVFSNFNGPYTGDTDIDALIAANSPTYLKANGWGYGFTAGILFQPDPVTRIGAGFRSIVSEQVSGHGEQFTSPGPTVPAPSQDFLSNAQTAVRSGIKTPAILALGAARDIANWTIKASLQINFWDSFKQISIYMPDAFATNNTIQTHWKNAWFAALGAEYRPTNAWKVRGGFAYDQTPTVNRYRDARIPDADRVWVNLGASYCMNKHLSFDGAYTHIFMQNQTVNVTQASGSSATSTVPLEVNQFAAAYRGSADIIALGVRYSF